MILFKLRFWWSLFKLRRAEQNRIKATKERIWIEENKHIHLFNYPYYKMLRILGK